LNSFQPIHPTSTQLNKPFRKSNHTCVAIIIICLDPVLPALTHPMKLSYIYCFMKQSSQSLLRMLRRFTIIVDMSRKNTELGEGQFFVTVAGRYVVDCLHSILYIFLQVNVYFLVYFINSITMITMYMNLG
jgi:hypothetical protein